MSKQLPENWTDKEFLEDATWLTPHERIEQEEYDALKIDKDAPIDIVLYPNTMTWTVE
jgi:hypothetical protein|tara:strand:+ start:1275 stop:1448 length:174 start_codon:yes stop_codon:yes gene_type:complete